MTEFKKETITTQENRADPNANPVAETPLRNKATDYQTVEYLVYFFFGVLEILLAFRLVLKLTGASLSSAFVGFIYSLTNIFVSPFEGIFHKEFAQGIETTSVLEPSALVAFVVYAVLAWGIVKLIRIFSGDRQVS